MTNGEVVREVLYAPLFEGCYPFPWKRTKELQMDFGEEIEAHVEKLQAQGLEFTTELITEIAEGYNSSLTERYGGFEGWGEFVGLLEKALDSLNHTL